MRRQPIVGDLITEGFGTYRVTRHPVSTRYEAVSLASGVTIPVNFDDSGYRDPANAWRLCDRSTP